MRPGITGEDWREGPRSARGTDLDLGDGHWLDWSWKHEEGEREPEERPVGATIWHQKPDGDLCVGAVSFVAGYGPPVWTVESWEPPTFSPSLLCHCGDHGFIREGRWVRA